MTEYSPQWFAERAAKADRDAQYMVPDVSCSVGKCPSSVYDFGCGDGAMLRWWHLMGATGLVGIDANGPDDWTRTTGGIHIRADLAQPIDLSSRAELVVCLEVAEHLPEEAADQLVENLVRHGDRILFSAAPPGQGGTGHVNEQPRSYWADKFARHGYVIQDIVRHRLHHDVSWWYRANTVLVCKAGHEVRIPRTKVNTARYRDCLREVEDSIARLTMSDFLPVVYGAPPFAKHELAYDAMVSKMRTALASQTIDNPEWAEFKYSLWVDADQAFQPQQAVDLVLAAEANGWDICSALYVTKQPEARIVHRMEGPPKPMAIGPYARPYTVDGIGFGFCVTRNDVFLRIATDDRSGVSRVWHSDGEYFWDLFRPINTEPRLDHIDPMTGIACGPSYNEDISFCEKAKACGIEVWVQPQNFVGHIGRYTYGMQNLKTQEVGK